MPAVASEAAMDSPLAAGATPAAGAELAGMTRLGDFYAGRYLGHSAARARALFTRWWALLRPELLGRPACPPRIWQT